MPMRAVMAYNRFFTLEGSGMFDAIAYAIGAFLGWKIFKVFSDGNAPRTVRTLTRPVACPNSKEWQRGETWGQYQARLALLARLKEAEPKAPEPKATGGGTIRSEKVDWNTL